MAHAYTPGLKVTPRLRHRVRRVLPIEGEVLVAMGDRVEATTVVARTLMPGDVRPVNVANALSIPAAEVPGAMTKQAGDTVAVGDVLARSKGLFGWFQQEYKSRVEGTIEAISGVTGQLIVRGEPIPIEVLAFLAGEVVEVLEGEGCVVEADAAYVQGIFGIGGEAYGPLAMAAAAPGEELKADMIRPEHAGTILVGGARMTGPAIRRAIEVGVAAVISGGIDDQDLRNVLGYDLGVAITGSERINRWRGDDDPNDSHSLHRIDDEAADVANPRGTTLIITEGFGEIAMAGRTFDLLKDHVGQRAAVNGATQIRAGVMRPEIVVPLTADERAEIDEPPHTPGLLEVGTTVRVIRDPHFGVIGTVASLPPEPRVLGSGSRARVLEVAVDGRPAIVVPRANVELVER